LNYSNILAPKLRKDGRTKELNDLDPGS
jgi:hypothetical protein